MHRTEASRSIAAIVLDREPRAIPVSEPRALAQSSLAGIALGSEPSRRAAVAVRLGAMTFVAVGLGVGATFVDESHRRRVAVADTDSSPVDAFFVSTAVPSDAIRETPAMPEPSVAPLRSSRTPRTSVPAPVEPTAIERPPPASESISNPPSAEPPPAETATAAQALTSVESGNDPSFSVPTGTGASYAGGVTSSFGTSGAPVSGTVPVATASPLPGTATSTATPTTRAPRPRTRWRCTMPGSARAAALADPSVLLELTVREDGSVTRAVVIDEPGYGLGAAASACALRERLHAARTPEGRAIAAIARYRIRFAD